VKSDATLVFVETDTGPTGVGTSLGSPPIVQDIIEDLLAPVVIGEDPMFSTELWERMYAGSRADTSLKRGHSQPRSDRRGMLVEAISGVGIALWDLKGRALDQPIYKLLGACRESVRAYASGGWAPARKWAKR
jgi:L-alanine-DL-glutamate epimerase-like enolase superfamily enzyme